MQVSEYLISRLPKKTAYFLQNMKHDGFNIDRIFTISKEILGDINGYYGISIVTKHIYRKWRTKRFISTIG